ncbi:prephenate dehydrogenase/arogenate dehydrogenase family protein [Corallococcus sp. Z5C101001]|uniref:prephenate dehydrogenase/arogenate dehydrogenase family protein n=1 Tax=Corallococcus sp. Z5C101001 TaxID=2596829 RepID=UPI00117C2782|nr:prephenate dehydrogenase/arogenate dehydrogenase family protein [Corallococcus sp. Z5C101001]TSC32846.1 prephenate dehydrogenase/arogenate dehydrogenase family protein [Corallococcus sp. Z5C101001]
MPQVALVGYGRFGRALGTLLEAAELGYRAMDPVAEPPEPLRARSVPELLEGAELVVVAVPVPRMREVLLTLRPHLTPRHLVLDVGSVKVKPVEALTEVLGAQVPWVGTHPLFGPLSLAMAERPMRVVLCPNPLHPDAAPRARRFYEALGCEVIEQTPEGHDRVMARTHALTFFVAKGMVDSGSAVDVPFAPASFKALSRTIETVRMDAGHLFNAIQQENPFATEARGRLLAALQAIHRDLEALPSGVQAREAAGLSAPGLEPGPPEVREPREHIDQLDRELVELLARRAELARRQRRAQPPGNEPARKEALLAVRRAWARELGLEPQEVEALFRVVLDARG